MDPRRGSAAKKHWISATKFFKMKEEGIVRRREKRQENSRKVDSYQKKKMKKEYLKQDEFEISDPGNIALQFETAPLAEIINTSVFNDRKEKRNTIREKFRTNEVTIPTALSQNAPVESDSEIHSGRKVPQNGPEEIPDLRKDLELSLNTTVSGTDEVEEGELQDEEN